MTYIKYFSFSLLLLFALSCGSSDDNSARQASVQNQPSDNPIIPGADAAATQVANPATPPTPPVEPPQNASGVWHYICPNGHAGGGGSATACPECGSTLEHNTAYHGDAAAPATPTDPAAAATAASTPATPPVEPPQNAAGVWHYVCPNGHAGGGGSATACPECGSTLEHNTAYHGADGATTPGSPIQVPGGTPATMFADPTKQPVNATIGAAPAAVNPTVAEPPQNAAGVWHYTCSNGCDGGAGSATACAKCGATLVHNTAYH